MKSEKGTASIKDEGSSNKYANLLKLYEYRPLKPITYDLTSYIGGS